MIYYIGNPMMPKECGGKAHTLSLLKSKGFNVPDGFVICSGELSQYINLPNLKEISSRLTIDNSALISAEINSILDKNEVYEFYKPNNLNPEKLYAVRSSGSLEDTLGMSFAGQYETVLNVTSDNISKAVDICCRSMYSPCVLSYLANNDISICQLRMSVIIQEMVKPEKSGVIFTLNPITGCDREVTVEISNGLAEGLVNGRVAPERHVIGWYESPSIDGDLLSSSEVEKLRCDALKIARLLGYPCDIEFAFSKGEIYILQARPITRIMYSGISDQWTTADFRDGGVSATVCLPYMWSLYEFVWETELKNFMLEAKILNNSQLRKLGEMFYGKPYWNLSVVKTAMSNIPGYKERDFDNSFGIKPLYEGDGKIVGISLKTIFRISAMSLAQRKIVGERRKKASFLKTDFLSRYDAYIEKKDCIFSQVEIEHLWLKLIRKDYLESESSYFRQIFINTIHQSLYKSKILKHTDESGYLRLIGGLDNISHLLPFYEIWNISRAVRNNQSALKYWTENSLEKICTDYYNGENEYFLDSLRKFTGEYGYHSKKELDVSYPCFAENASEVISQLFETISMDDGHSPDEDRKKLSKLYKNELNRIPKKMHKTIEEMRLMLWWREEFRDISTRFYYIIRIFTIKLAETWSANGIILSPDDIWYLKIDDIQRFINKQSSASHLRGIISRNREYYEIYRNFNSENEIGRAFSGISVSNLNKKNTISGIGCSCGEVEGNARVITDISDIDKIQFGDILVTKYTDTGWTPKFALLSGIVTEYGGMLCHAAIVSREYDIACVICATNATQKISDGDRIKINGKTGEVSIIKNKESAE